MAGTSQRKNTQTSGSMAAGRGQRGAFLVFAASQAISAISEDGKSGCCFPTSPGRGCRMWSLHLSEPQEHNKAPHLPSALLSLVSVLHYNCVPVEEIWDGSVLVWLLPTSTASWSYWPLQGQEGSSWGSMAAADLAILPWKEVYLVSQLRTRSLVVERG